MSIVSETTDGVARIQIARPEKKNAITSDMYQQLADAIDAARGEPTVNSILIHGQSELFTAGNDLEDFLNHPPSDRNAPVFRFMRALMNAEKPVIAAVNGAAVGIGTTMLAHCDFVYCADNAMFSMPFVSLGLCPEFGSSVLIALLGGSRKAAEKLLLGAPISAEEALDMRIVSRLLPPAEVLAHAKRQAMRFNTMPAEAVRDTKRLLKAPWRAMVEKAIDEETTTFARLLYTSQAKEALSAFLQKRVSK